MRRLYMQKNKDTGSRGMVAMGWLCEGCNFSDIVTRFKESRPAAPQHPALMCECQICGSTHKRGDSSGITQIDEHFMEHMLEKLSNPEKQIDGLALINNLETPSTYLGLVLGSFIWSENTGDTRQIAKDVFTTHATDLQRTIIDSVFKESWKRKGWTPLHGKRFKKKVKESSIDIDQIFGMGIILNQRITELTFKTIDMLESPETYVDVALKVNPHLAGEYAERAANEGDKELAAEYLKQAIKGGQVHLARKYADLQGPEATQFLIEQFEEHSQTWDWSSSYNFCASISRTGSPEAARFLIKTYCEEDTPSRSHISQMGDENSENSLIRALAPLPDYFDVSKMAAVLVSGIDDYKSIESLSSSLLDGLEGNEHHRKADERTVSLFREVIDSSGDYEKTRRFIREATEITGDYYKHYLLKKDSAGIRKFLFSDDPALRLMGTSMGKSADLGTELEEYVFAMSFVDSEESVREGATELLKERGISQITDIFDSRGSLFIKWNWRGDLGTENLERLIGYEDSRFVPTILEHIHDFADYKNQLTVLLEKLKPDKKQIVEMLLKIAIEAVPKGANMSVVTLDTPIWTTSTNAVRTALNTDRQIACDKIKAIIKTALVDSRVKLQKLIFVMSFLDNGKSIREGATELVKEIGISQLTNIFDSEGLPTFNYRWQNEYTHTKLFHLHRKENLERLIGYSDSRFVPIILKHIGEFEGLNLPFIVLLETFNPDKNQNFEMLFQLAIEEAPQPLARNAAMIALDIDRQEARDRIRAMMLMTTGKERVDRKQSVNRRLMFIEIFATIATPDDLLYLQELMKKDRSPRVKRILARMIAEITP